MNTDGLEVLNTKLAQDLAEPEARKRYIYRYFRGKYEFVVYVAGECFHMKTWRKPSAIVASTHFACSRHAAEYMLMLAPITEWEENKNE